MIIWDEAPLELLSSVQARQHDALTVVKEAFDLSFHELELLRQKLRTENPDSILPFVAQFRDQSASHFYQLLDWKLGNNAFVSGHDFIPHEVRMLLRHLRLEAEAEQRSGLPAQEDVGASLLAELPLQSALERLIAIPSPIGSEAFERLRKRPEAERRSIMRHLAKLSNGNPIALAHTIRLLYAFGEDNTAYVRWADRLVSRLLSFEGSPALGAMLQVLTVVEREFSSHEPFSTYPSRTRLLMIWSHVSSLQRISGRGGTGCRPSSTEINPTTGETFHIHQELSRPVCSRP